MISIRPSSHLRNKYAEIAQYCKETGEPVYLTNNGEGDLVVMDINAFDELTHIPEILIELEKARKERENGVRGYSLEEALAKWQKTIDEADYDEV